jgi:hypothetical protein
LKWHNEEEKCEKEKGMDRKRKRGIRKEEKK